MATTYTPAAGDADEDAHAGQAFDDPIVYTAANNKRVDSKYFLKPVQDEVLGLIKGRVASQAYRITWTCGSGDAVGSPVRISGNDTVTTALATTAANSKVIGFIRYKPTATTCYIDHFRVATGLSGLTAGNDVFLTDAGSFSASAGTYRKVLGLADSTTSAVLFATSFTGMNNGNLFNDGEGNPANIATASSDGTSTFVARRDHVHTIPADVIPGVITVSDAAAGIVGEVARATQTVSTNIATTNTYQNLASISLTAGDWDVSGHALFLLNGATMTTFCAAAVSIHSDTTTTDHQSGDNVAITFPPDATANPTVAIPAYRINVSSTTTVYLKVLANFSAGNPQARGRISARRAR